MDDMQRWIDKLKIHDLVAEATLSIDRRDLDGWANCFTEDGFVGFGDQCIRGRKNLREYAKVHASVGSRHLTTSPRYNIAADGQSATGAAISVVLAPTLHGFKILFSGGITDKLKKVNEQWLFTERWVKGDEIPGRPDFFAGSADPDVEALVQPLFESFERLGEKI